MEQTFPTGAFWRGPIARQVMGSQHSKWVSEQVRHGKHWRNNRGNGQKKRCCSFIAKSLTPDNHQDPFPSRKGKAGDDDTSNAGNVRAKSPFCPSHRTTTETGMHLIRSLCSFPAF
mmetsp:Transcript_4439/g.15796  ORF Transcript_4439/g.15796 Transcript_4439/m.15796 type:complete len:116 (-) Transcript_4439:105-452(-)